MIQKRNLKGAGILFLDIETSHNIGVFFRPGKQYVSHKQILQEAKIICVCYKWGGEDKVYTEHFGLKKQDDTPLLRKIVKVINSAECVITQNGDRFDLPWIQHQLCVRGLPPINSKPHLLTLDTLKASRCAFNRNSHSLDYRSRLYGYGGKIRMQQEDWIDIIWRKDPKAFEKMLRYCPKDVKDLEKVFLKELPYIKLPPWFGILLGGSRSSCPACGSDKRRSRGYVCTQSGIMKHSWECMNRPCVRRYVGERI